MGFLPPEQRIHQAAGPAAYAIQMPAPAVGGQCFVRPDHRQGRGPDTGKQQRGQQAAQTMQRLVQRDDGLPAVVPDDLAPRHACTSGSV